MRGLKGTGTGTPVRCATWRATRTVPCTQHHAQPAHVVVLISVIFKIFLISFTSQHAPSAWTPSTRGEANEPNLSAAIKHELNGSLIMKGTCRCARSSTTCRPRSPSACEAVSTRGPRCRQHARPVLPCRCLSQLSSYMRGAGCSHDDACACLRPLFSSRYGAGTRTSRSSRRTASASQQSAYPPYLETRTPHAPAPAHAPAPDVGSNSSYSAQHHARETVVVNRSAAMCTDQQRWYSATQPPPGSQNTWLSARFLDLDDAHMARAPLFFGGHARCAG